MSLFGISRLLKSIYMACSPDLLRGEYQLLHLVQFILRVTSPPAIQRLQRIQNQNQIFTAMASSEIL